MIYNVQALRAVAAFLVLFVHADLLFGGIGIGPAALRFGHTGVDLFFVISGFIIVHTGLRSPTTVSAFLKNRLLRVLPLYWLMTIAVLVLAQVAPLLLQSTSPNAADIAKSLAFIPFEKRNGLVQPILFVGWTLNYEMLFYVLFAFALLLAQGRMALTVAIAIVALVLTIVLARTFPIGDVIHKFYGNDILFEFPFGMLVALAFHYLPLRGISTGLVILVIGSVALIGLPFVPTIHIRPVTAGFPACLILVGALMMEKAGLRANGRSVQSLGAASFALYLTHPFILRGAAKIDPHQGPLAGSIKIVLAFLLAEAAALFIYRYLEVPMTRLLRAATGYSRPAVTEAARRAESGSPTADRVLRREDGSRPRG